MVQRREKFVLTRAARLVLGVTMAAGLGAAVCASPIRSLPAAPSMAPIKVAAVAPGLQPLGDGPAITVQKSFGRNDEDCVTVTSVKGTDGRVYASRGMVCAQ